MESRACPIMQISFLGKEESLLVALLLTPEAEYASEYAPFQLLLIQNSAHVK